MKTEPTTAGTLLSPPPCSRFRIEERSGIVAIYDTHHPEYEDTVGCHADYPWVVCSWGGRYVTPPDPECLNGCGHWTVEKRWKKKAHQTCDLLNSLCANAKLSHEEGEINQSMITPTTPPPSSLGAASCSALPPVLDACCSTRSFWFCKQDSRAIFMDKRAEECPIKPDKSHPARNLVVSPDVVADFTRMPFEDESFWHVVFDPPHAKFGERSVMAKTYGTLRNVDWKEMLRGGFSECFRVLKPNGTLIFKWCEWEIPLREVLALTPHAPLYGHISGKRAQTHWCAFLKQNAQGDSQSPAKNL